MLSRTLHRPAPATSAVRPWTVPRELSSSVGGPWCPKRSLDTEECAAENRDARAGALGALGKAPLRLGLGEKPCGPGAETSVSAAERLAPSAHANAYRAIWMFNLGAKPGTMGL
jgi:hypothetical protein